MKGVSSFRRTLLLHAWLQTALWVALVLVGNHLGSAVFARIDVTRDQRFSLSNTARRAVVKLNKPLQVRVYFTHDLDPPYHNHEQALLDKLDELQAWAGAEFTIKRIDPTGNKERIEEARRFGVEPVTYTYKDWDREEARQVFLGVAFVYGNRQSAVAALPSIARMEYELVRAIQTVATPPDERKVVGYLQGNGEPELAGFPSDNPLGQLRDAIQGHYELRPIGLDGDDPVPDDVDALLVIGPQQTVSDRVLFHLDQYVMGGGAVGWFLSGHQPDFSKMTVREVRHGLHPLLGHYGVRLGRNLLLDRQHNEALVVPVDLGGRRVLARVNYPLALATTALDRTHHAVRDLRRAVLPFAGSLTLRDDLEDAIAAETWIRTLPDAVLVTDVRNLDPKVLNQPFPHEEPGSHAVAVALSGSFQSFFAERPPPAPADPNAAPVDPSEVLVESAPTRMVVVSSADMIANNQPFVQNVVDWMLEDARLIGIRARDTGPDLLEAPDAADAWKWKLAIGAGPFALLLLLGAIGRWRSA